MTEKFEEDLMDEFTRMFMQNLHDSVIGDGHTITLAEAQAARDAAAKLVRTEQMMLDLIGRVMQRMPGDTWVVLMNTEHLQWLRGFHQAHQRAKLYKGGKFPELLSVPIKIREDISEPRLRDELSHGVVLP